MVFLAWSNSFTKMPYLDFKLLTIFFSSFMKVSKILTFSIKYLLEASKSSKSSIFLERLIIFYFSLMINSKLLLFFNFSLIFKLTLISLFFIFKIPLNKSSYAFCKFYSSRFLSFESGSSKSPL